MKDRTILVSALIACSVHVLLLFLNIGMTPPGIASAVSTIEVTLVGPPEPSPEPEIAAEPEAEVEAEPVVAPEPAAEIEPEPEPLPIPEPAPVFEPEPLKEIEVPEESYDIEPPKETYHFFEPIEEEMRRDHPTGRPSIAASTDEVKANHRIEGIMTAVDRPPAYTYNPKPRYPRAARRLRQEGGLLLLVEVLPNGRVGKIEIEETSGYELLDNAAIEAVQNWRFVPAKRGMVPVRARVRIPVEFNLKD